MKDYVRERRLRRREMFVPLSHPPGHAQADFGEADAIIAGVKYRAHFFVMTLPHSDACFVAAYPAAATEAWLDGHNMSDVNACGTDFRFSIRRISGSSQPSRSEDEQEIRNQQNLG